MEDFNHFLIRNLSKIAIIETNRSEHRVFLKTHYFVGLPPQFGKAVARRRTASTSRFGLRMRATERFDRGLTDSLNVIDAQRQQYLIEQEYVLAQQGAADQFVTLHKSLGAGWEDYQTRSLASASARFRAAPRSMSCNFARTAGRVVLSSGVSANTGLRCRKRDFAGQRQRRLLRREAQDLKEVVAEQALELRLLKKSMIGDGGDQT